MGLLGHKQSHRPVLLHLIVQVNPELEIAPHYQFCGGIKDPIDISPDRGLQSKCSQLRFCRGTAVPAKIMYFP